MKKFMISNACCGDASSEIVLANCKADIAYHYLLKCYYNEYWCGSFGFEKTRDNCVRAYLVKSGIRDEYEMKKMRAKKEESILKTLTDDEIITLFEYMYTGGDGDQSGIPGKEWETIEITEITEDNFRTFESRPRK